MKIAHSEEVWNIFQILRLVGKYLGVQVRVQRSGRSCAEIAEKAAMSGWSYPGD